LLSLVKDGCIPLKQGGHCCLEQRGHPGLQSFKHCIGVRLTLGFRSPPLAGFQQEVGYHTLFGVDLMTLQAQGCLQPVAGGVHVASDGAGGKIPLLLHGTTFVRHMIQIGDDRGQDLLLL